MAEAALGSGESGQCCGNCGSCAGSCWCDNTCTSYGDCCSNYEMACIQNACDGDDGGTDDPCEGANGITVDVYIAAFASEVSWTLGSCSGGSYGSNGYQATEICSIDGGVYTLTCSDSYGDGWHGGYITIGGETYCNSFSSGYIYDETVTVVLDSDIASVYYELAPSSPGNKGNSICSGMDLVYASIHSANQNAAAQSACVGENCWIGFHDSTDEGKFEWYDGSASDFSNWDWGEPNDWGWKGEDCTRMFSDGLWNDYGCSNWQPILCMGYCEAKNPTITPSNEPTFNPTPIPTNEPTISPTDQPSFKPTKSPTDQPTFKPTPTPTRQPTYPKIECSMNKANPTDPGILHVYTFYEESGLNRTNANPTFTPWPINISFQEDNPWVAVLAEHQSIMGTPCTNCECQAVQFVCSEGVSGLWNTFAVSAATFESKPSHSEVEDALESDLASNNTCHYNDDLTNAWVKQPTKYVLLKLVSTGPLPITTEKIEPLPTTTEKTVPLPTTTMKQAEPLPTTTEKTIPLPTTTMKQTTSTEKVIPLPTTTMKQTEPLPTTTEKTVPLPTTTEQIDPLPTTTIDQTDPLPTTTEQIDPLPTTTIDQTDPLPTTTEQIDPLPSGINSSGIPVWDAQSAVGLSMTDHKEESGRTIIESFGLSFVLLVLIICLIFLIYYYRKPIDEVKIPLLAGSKPIPARNIK